MIINMGLMSKLNKMKSFLFDEEDEEKEEKKQGKKDLKKEDKITPQKEIVMKKDEDEKIEELYFEEEKKEDKIINENNEIKSRTSKIEEKFKFPEFDDDDFMVVNKKPEPIIPVKKPEPKRTLYQGSKRKEDKKFKPSPIISPIYGLLDNQGNMVKEEKKADKTPLYSEEKTFDEVRKKAYGKLDEELESTLKRLSNKTIEEAEKQMQEEEELSRQKKHKKQEEKASLITSLKENEEEDDDDDDMILPNVNFKEIDVDKEKNKSLKKDAKNKVANKDDDDDDDTKEQDLFNLIDTMYQNKEEE